MSASELKYALHDLAILRATLSYDKGTGQQHWLIKAGPFVQVGDLAGSLNKDGHRYIYFQGKSYAAHRLAWLHFHGELPNGFVDHINGERDDNRPANLRVASFAINSQNQRCAHRNNTSGALGVKATRSGRYEAAIQLNGRKFYLGTFDTAEAAHQVYVEAKRELHPGCTI